PWRHRGLIRPNLDSSQKLFNTTQQNFVSVVNRTLQGYLDRNLSIHKLHLYFRRQTSPYTNSRPSISLLDKWIAIIVVLNIKVLKLDFLAYSSEYYDLPSGVFLAECLEELHLSKCRLSPAESVRFKSLRKLTLELVQVDDGTLETITLGCPLLRRLVIHDCRELRNVRLSKAASPGLKHFKLCDSMWIEGRNIEIDVPNLETGGTRQEADGLHGCKECALPLRPPWRNRGSTRPNLDSSQKLFNTPQQNFVSVVDRTLQGYSDQNLSIHKLHLDFPSPDSRPVISLLDKWIPMIPALNIKSFKLNFRSFTLPYYSLPSAVFLAESLEELHLQKCRVSPVESVRFKHLRTLTLEHVQVDGGTFETKMLGCPLLRRLVINICRELRNVRLSNAPGLKHFALIDFKIIEGRSIEIDVPNLETSVSHNLA
ncbi:F-box family protein, partial [Striga asiatica]